MSRERERVFLSYRRADTQHVAGRAADKLADRFELFMDVDTIPPGVDYTDYLKRAVGGCDVLLAFIGERWATLTDGSGRRRLDDPDDWVVAEIAAALARDVPVIPVLVDGASLPTPEELPPQLRQLTKRQATRLRFESFSADLAHLVAAVEHARRPGAEGAGTGGEAVPGADGTFADRWEQTPRPHDRTPVALAVPSRRPRLTPILVGAALVAALGVGAWAVLGRGQPTPAAPSVVATPSPARTPSASPVPTVPPAIRSSCRGLNPSDQVLARDLVVALQCAPSKTGKDAGPRYAFYFQYRDASGAETAFRDYYASGPPGPGDCRAEPGEAADERAHGSPSGMLRCYRDTDGYAVLAWVAPEQAIVASAADRDRSFTELFSWWEGAGPTLD